MNEVQIVIDETAGKGITCKKRTASQLLDDRAFCASYLLRSYSIDQITRLLNERNTNEGRGYTITRQQVGYDLKLLRTQWKAAALESIGDQIVIELEKLDLIERELWDAWDRSKGRKERVKSKVNKTDKDGSSVDDEVERTTETLNGDPRYMTLILQARERRAALLGLDQPLRPSPVEDKRSFNINQIPESLQRQIADHIQNIPDLPSQDFVEETEYTEATDVSDEIDS